MSFSQSRFILHRRTQVPFCFSSISVTSPLKVDLHEFADIREVKSLCDHSRAHSTLVSGLVLRQCLLPGVADFHRKRHDKLSRCTNEGNRCCIGPAPQNVQTAIFFTQRRPRCTLHRWCRLPSSSRRELPTGHPSARAELRSLPSPRHYQLFSQRTESTVPTEGVLRQVATINYGEESERRDSGVRDFDGEVVGAGRRDGGLRDVDGEVVCAVPGGGN